MKQEAFRPVFSASFVTQALGLTLPGVLGTQPYSSVTTDSRKIRPGCLFVALKGDKFDGHDFIGQAVEQGATGVICRRDFPRPANCPSTRFFAVEDTLSAYRRLAGAWRREFPVPVIAVAGSVGKTTTKELLSAILSGRFKDVLKTRGSQNGFVGIPMTLLELEARHGVAVIEVGIDDIGAMEQHIQLVSPGVTVLTAIGPEHLEKLKDIPTVAREEGLALSMTARTGGTAVINLDDSWVRPFAQTLRSAGKRLGFTLNAVSPTPASNMETLRGNWDENSGALKVQGAGWDEFSVQVPLPGRHNASNLLAAFAVANALGLTSAEAERGLGAFEGAAGRSEIRELPDGTVVVCDYYNANPTSVEAGLEVLSQLARARRAPARWACLGDMLELGPDEEKFHRGLAGKLAALAVENVLLYGPRMRALESELGSRSFAGKVSHFESHAALATALKKGYRPGDAILIKGSRSMKMEEVWKTLPGNG